MSVNYSSAKTMEDTCLKDVKKLIEEHRKSQDKNIKLVSLLNAKMLEIKTLTDRELNLQCQIRDALVHTVNVENLSSHYVELKEKYKNLVNEKNVVEDTFKKKEEELIEQHEKQLKLYQDMLAKEQEKFQLKEKEYFNDLKKTSTALNEQVQQVELKWKMLLEDANRKLKDSNLSCTTLRSQLVQANYRHANVDFMEKKVRVLETKLEEKNNELHIAQQALFVKEHFKITNSPPRDLYKRHSRTGPYKMMKKLTSSNICGDVPPTPGGENCFRHMVSTKALNKLNLPSSSQSTAENIMTNTSMNVIGNKHNIPSSCEDTPVKEVPHKSKKRKLYDPSSAQLDFLLHNLNSGLK